jgi:aconitate hydratase
MTFADEADYDRISFGDELTLPGVRALVEGGSEEFVLRNETKGEEYKVLLPLTQRQKGCILCGGLLNYTREMNK